MGFEIAVASVADARVMVEWAAAEGWNPGDTDMQAFLVADPAAFLIGRLDGEPVTCISVVEYGTGFGFLGFYIARPAVRGQGLGMQTWRAGMARLSGRNVALDGVVAQQDNYRTSGFVHAWNNIRFQGRPGKADVPDGVRLVDACSVGLDRLSEYDRRFFPAGRAGFLAAWIGLPQRHGIVALREGCIAGFGVIRPGCDAFRLGPLYAEDEAVATAVVAELAGRAGSHEVAIDIPDTNVPAMRMAQRFGMAPAFETARMYTAGVPDLDYAGLYGTTSLELG